MELKPGYKQTEVGVIPNDWDVLRLSDTCVKIQDGTHFSPSSGGNEYLYITSKNIRFGYIDVSTATRIDKRQHDAIYRRCDVKKGDLLLTKDGANTGNAALNTLDEEISLLSSVAFLRFDPEMHHAPYFLQQILSKGGQRQIQEAMSGNAITRLTLNKINRLHVPIPRMLDEEEQIAQILSDADALIESLEQLLAKKRQIKQGAMQELLTGEKRLPGFTGKWEERALTDLFDFSGGLSASREQLGSGGFCYLHYGDIHAATETFIDVRADRQRIPKLDIKLSKVSPKSLLADGDVVFVDASEDDEGTSRHVVILNEDGIPFISGLHTIVAKCKTEDLDREYKRYCFQTRAVKSQFMFFAVGTKVSGISKTNIAKVRIPLPPVSEQAAIAGILVDMDAEIAALETKLVKARQIKQGMMQELLTGRIRLVQPSAEVVPFPAKQNASASTNASHNQQINEAVVLAVLAHRFGSEQFPLGRFRRTKLSYLLHRHTERQVTGFMKKAAGPYSPQTRYGGAEKIALKNSYVRIHQTAKGEGFIAADNIAQAEGYFESWYGLQVLDWLKQFRYKKNEELELLTTVDMAIEDLRRDGKSVTVSAVKQIIHDSPEWNAKLDRAAFADSNIAAAIESCRQLFPVEE